MGTYLFIDGNYLEERYRAKMQAFYGDDGDLDYESLRTAAVKDLRRAFYYNAIDYGARKGETEPERDARVSRLQQRFDAIEAVRDVHVRPGAVTMAARKRREQKKVDILLAVDMLTHAHNRNMDKAVLIAGDLDFAPLVAAVVRLGIRVGVLYDSASYAPELLEEADFGTAIGLRDYFVWSSPFFRSSREIPHETDTHGEDFRASVSYVEIGGGRLGSAAVSLLLMSDHAWVVLIRDELQRLNRIITDTDRARLVKYAALEYPDIEWEEATQRRLREP